MTGKTHLAIGMAAAAAMLQTQSYTLEQSVVMVLAVALGSLLPDLDSPNSVLSSVLPFNLSFVGHRGVLHSGAIAASLVALSYYTQSLLIVSLTIGYLLHLCADMLTVRGIPLFYPVQSNVSVLPLKTGGIIDTLLFAGCWVAVVWLTWLTLT